MTLLRSLFTNSTALAGRSIPMETCIFSTMASDTSTFIPIMTTTSSGLPISDIAKLVSGAILEVVCMALPGFLLAKAGKFTPKQQKFLSELNINLFTPCLIFIKLGSKLEVSKLKDLAIIPLLWIMQVLISWASAKIVSKSLGFYNRSERFITAMAVFGNSSSLPMSLITSLSMTISGLHWDQIPGDDDKQVSARGILYLLIFQQLGQLIRWTWGDQKLLKKREEWEEYDDGTKPLNAKNPNEKEPESWRDWSKRVFRFRSRNDTRDHDSEEREPLLPASSSTSTRSTSTLNDEPKSPLYRKIMNNMSAPLWAMLVSLIVAVTPFLKNLFFTEETFVYNSITLAIAQCGNVAVPLILVILGGNLAEVETETEKIAENEAGSLCTSCGPNSKQNPDQDTSASTSETSSITETGPVIESNSTQYDTISGDITEPIQGRHDAKSYFNRLLFASLIARMVLPFMFMFPLLSLISMYMQVSVLDDPIFAVVCCLLAGAPTALQMTQICSKNNVYEKIMARILFWSYVICILPSTLIVVVAGIKIVDWSR